MALVPEEIAGKQFIVGLRGYDRDEVQAFLRAVAEELRRLHLELETARIPAPDSPEALGTQVAAVMRSAQEQAKELRQAAMTEVAGAVEEAKAEAVRVVEEARRDAATIMEEVRNRAAQIDAEARTRGQKAMSIATERFRVIRTAELEVAQRIEESQGLLDAVRQELAADDLQAALEEEGLVVVDVSGPRAVDAAPDGAAEAAEQAETLHLTSRAG